MEFFEAVYARRSIREFSDKKVGRDLIEQMLKAGMSGPTALGKCPWKMMVLDSKESIEKLQESLPYGRYNCTAAVVVMGDAEISKHYWAVDAIIAATNITNAAAALGVDSVFVGLYPFEKEWQAVQEKLGLAENVKPACVIELGYAKEKLEPRTQYCAERVVWEG